MTRAPLIISVLAATLYAPSALAVPAFARATGMGCPACHESWPQLNDVGELYRDRGYRTTGTPADTADRSLDYVPVTLRTFLGYQVTHGENDPSTPGVTLNTGSFVDPGADLIFAMNLARHFSVLAVVSGFASDGAAALESAWVRINDIADSSWLNLRVGRHELDLPMSQHRAYELTTDPPFSMFNYHPAGSKMGYYGMGDNQLGIELSGHGDGPGLRYAVSLVGTGADRSGALSGPTAYGHVTWTRQLDSPLRRLRLGAFADFGRAPSTIAVDGDGTPILGTGRDDKGFYHAGAEVHVTLGPIATPLLVHVVYQYGREAKEIVAGTRDAQWHGVLAELDWIPLATTTVFGRAELIRNLRQGDPATAGSENDVTAFALGLRYSLFLSSWGAISAHGEISTTGTTTGGQVQRGTAFIAGVDVAI
jgi:hypothetical protein